MTDKLKKGQTNEPLKEKIDYPVGINQDYKEGKFGGHHHFFDGDDIKSAVEWLKEELKKHNDRPQYNKEWVIELINKAFEDVIK